ncbi:MAG: hypothetical protein FWC00_06130, partial [Firmicutes bacterium]|nr:hypothetical protein [Bacillota bacterium]
MKKTLIVDLDEVLVEKAMLIRVNEFLGTNHTLEDIKGFRAQDLVPTHLKLMFLEYLLKVDFYKDAKIIPTPREIEILKRLNDKYDMSICSDYITPEVAWESGKFCGDKLALIRHNFPFMTPDKVMFVPNKKCLACDIQIDDRLSQLSPFAKQGILFTAPHNAEIT